MRHGKQILILITAFFILFIFVLITYFYIYSGTLIKFVTDSPFIFAYFNKDWIEKTGFEQTITQGGYGLFTRVDFKGALICFSKKLISLFSKEDFIGRIYIDLSYVKGLLNKERSQIPEHEFAKINIYVYPVRSSPDVSGRTSFSRDSTSNGVPLIFKSEKINTLSIQSSGITPQKFDTGEEEPLNFILLSSEELKTIKQKIAIELSILMPIERQVVLPDGSVFTELVVDPTKFIFEKSKIKGTEFMYWQNPDPLLSALGKGREIVMWRGDNYSFVSNNLSLAKDAAAGQIPCLFRASGKDFKKAIYFELKNYGTEDIFSPASDSRLPLGSRESNLELKNYGIEDIFIIEKSNRLEGCFNLAPYPETSG